MRQSTRSEWLRQQHSDVSLSGKQTIASRTDSTIVTWSHSRETCALAAGFLLITILDRTLPERQEDPD